MWVDGVQTSKMVPMEYRIVVSSSFYRHLKKNICWEALLFVKIFVQVIAVSWGGTMTMGWTDYFYSALRRSAGWCEEGVSERWKVQWNKGLEDWGRMSKGDEKIKELGTTPSNTSESPQFHYCSLSRDKLLITITSLSAFNRGESCFFLYVAPFPRLFCGRWWSIREM